MATMWVWLVIINPLYFKAMSSARKSRVRYSRLTQVSRDHDETEYSDEQFTEAPPKIPLKSIALAILLFSLGSVLLMLAILMFVGVFGDNPDASATPLIIIGAITFIPGFYHVRLAYYAWKGYHGYSFDDIPSYDD